MLSVQAISKLGIGGWGLGGLAKHEPSNDDEKQVNALTYAFNKGLNLVEINFWNSEGHSAKLIHEALSKSSKDREDVFLPLVIYDYTNPTLANVENEIEKFLELYQTDYIDSLEFPLSAFHAYGFENVVSLVQKYLSSGKARFTSITNCNLEYLTRYHEIFKGKLFSHEIHYSFEVRDNENLGIVDYAKQHGIRNIIFQPLRRNRTAKRDWPLLVELSQKYNKTQNQIILNWMVSKGFLPLVKSENLEHIDENIESLNFELSDKDKEKLDSFTVANYKEPEIDWFMEGKGTPIFAVPNIFDELYPANK